MAIDNYPPKSKKKRKEYWDDLSLIEYANEHPTKDDRYEDARGAVNDEILDRMRKKRLKKMSFLRKQSHREARAQKRVAKKTRKEITRQTMARVRAKKIRRRFSLSCFMFPFISAILWGFAGYVLKTMMAFYFPHVNPMYLLAACLVPAALFLLSSLKALLFGGFTFGSTMFLYLVSAVLIVVLPFTLVFLVSDRPIEEFSAFLRGVVQMPFFDYFQ